MLLLVVPLTGCGSWSYYRDAAIGQMRLLAARRPVAEVLADAATPPETVANLARVDAMLVFAQEHLELSAGNRYRSYVALDRDAVAWNVFAAPEFSLTPHQWCYPIIGCAVYRGFFDPADAEREAAALTARGFDVHVGRVAAYSTLGWFDDPLLSTFIDYPDARLAELLFHELAHGVLFVPGDSAFNEAYATFVGREGATQWLRATGRDPEPYLAAERASMRRTAFFRTWRDRLKALYAAPLASDQRRLLKSALFEAMRTCYAESGFGAPPAPPWPNNAHLAAIGTYEDRTGAFAALLARVQGDWSAFHRSAREIADRARGAREEALRDLALTHDGHQDPTEPDTLLCHPPDATSRPRPHGDSAAVAAGRSGS